MIPSGYMYSYDGVIYFFGSYTVRRAARARRIGEDRISDKRRRFVFRFHRNSPPPENDVSFVRKSHSRRERGSTFPRASSFRGIITRGRVSVGQPLSSHLVAASSMSAPHGDTAVAPRAFIKLPDPSSSPWAFTDASSRSFLRKWDLDTHARVARFRYTKPFHRMDADEFVRDFFDSDVVNEHFRVLDRAKRWRSVREIVRDAGEDGGKERDANAKKEEEKKKTEPIAVASASYAKTPCSAVSMSLFDRLRDDTPEPRITRAGDSDALVRKIEETIDGFAVGDNLRACLVDACDENHETLFSEAEKAEFLFRVFSHLVLGGSMCQYEETLSPYEDVAKAVYKSLVRAKKDGDGAAVASDVYSATAIFPAGGTKNAVSLFPRPNHVQNFCYLCVDPWRRHVTVWYHAHVPHW